MSRIAQRFADLQVHNEKALVGFVTIGDPTPEQTVPLVVTLAEAGVDIVELGIPFSDPLADGPSIQASSQRALQNGITVAKSLDILHQIRAKCPNLPLIVMTYYNPILRYGLARYAADAKQAGVDGHIVTDLTPEEAGTWKRLSDEHRLDTIFLLAPTSTEARIQSATKLCSGFVYCVSRTGVTGARRDVPQELTAVVTRIRHHTNLPICVGFGVSQPEHVRSICHFADGVVVGSALVDLIHAHRNAPSLLSEVYRFAHALKTATRST
ncbi:MAG TPA: tryptophan synthase subunit alpha [Chthonomonas sp.]|uniref:tryptophan synthase subunit alpha n=1 Tax=Chthonomonas sp. TaxID=2282153 RepID=UPI002B4AC424|nr:tryptophan synthase subunit alpha [Chthonomonas sp.]HLI47782.1 tryptophan synthase subunit alpha [Chthonomonas sp.]